jgi:hypothetical protein
VIGDSLTEVNVTSPTCFQEITQQTGFDVAAMFVDALEKQVKGEESNWAEWLGRGFLAVWLLGFLLAGCGEIPAQAAVLRVRHPGGNHRLRRKEDKARQVTDQVLKDFDAMHQTLHAWQPGALEQLNASDGPGQTRCPRAGNVDARNWRPCCKMRIRLSARAEGLFNPAIGNLVRLWGFHSDTFEARLPDPGEIERLVKAAIRHDGSAHRRPRAERRQSGGTPGSGRLRQGLCAGSGGGYCGVRASGTR